MATIEAATVTELLEKVSELEPLIRQFAPEAERERRLSKPVVEALIDAGLYKMFRPRSRGGLELDPVSTFRVIEAISRIDGSTGWNVQISNTVDPFGAWFPDSVTEEVFGPERTTLAGAFNPPRKAVPAEGGYRLSGTTTFNSNCHNATWLCGLANIFDDDGEEPRLNDLGDPVTLLTFFPAHECEIIDNWNTLGMCGTGSHDVYVDNIFVPEERAALWVPLEEASSAFAGPLHRLSIWNVHGCLVSPALGIAQAAIDDLVELGSKVPAYAENTIRDRPAVQLQLAQAEGKLASARTYFHAIYDELWQRAIDGHSMEMPDRAKCQLAVTHALGAATEAVIHVHACVGASGIRNEYNFQKYFRDIHVITQHAFIAESRLESVGQIMLGLEPDWPFFQF